MLILPLRYLADNSITTPLARGGSKGARGHAPQSLDLGSKLSQLSGDLVFF